MRERGRENPSGAGENSGTGGKEDGSRRQGELKNGFQRQHHQQQSYGQWQTHHSRHSKKQAAAKNHQWRPKVQVTSYFVYNLPEEISEQDLFEAYKPFGDLFSTCIPPKKDCYGNRFGFVRYKNVEDKLAFEKSLVNVKLGGAVIGVNLSKHDRMLLHSHPTTKPNTQTQPKQRNSSLKNTTSHNLKPHSEPIPSNPTPFGSFKDILNNRNTSNHTLKTIILNPTEPPILSSLKDLTLLLEVKTLEFLNTFDSICKDMGIKDHILRYLGGMNILITFANAEGMDAFSKDSALWDPYVKMITKWDYSYKQKERIAWLYIRGVPGHLYNRETFELIANSYGNIIKQSCASPKDAILSYDCIGISTLQSQRIFDNITVKWRTETHSITIEEEIYQWYPAFLNSDQSPKKVPSQAKENQESIVSESESTALNLNPLESATLNTTPPNNDNHDAIFTDTVQQQSNIPPTTTSSENITAHSASLDPPPLSKPLTRKRQRTHYSDPLRVGPSSPTNFSFQPLFSTDPTQSPFIFNHNLTPHSIQPSSCQFDPNLKFPTIIQATHQPPTVFNSSIFHQNHSQLQEETPLPTNLIFTAPRQQMEHTHLDKPTTPPPAEPAPDISTPTQPEPTNYSSLHTSTSESNENLKFAKLLGINEKDCVKFLANIDTEQGTAKGVANNGSK